MIYAFIDSGDENRSNQDTSSFEEIEEEELPEK